MSPDEVQPVPAVERQLAVDMIRRALPLIPVVAALAAIGWGLDGALSATFGVALVLGNLALSALMLTIAARISVKVLAAVAMFGFFARMIVVVLLVLAVRNQGWVERVPLGITLVGAHLGLLVWEARHVSASLAFPGLKPSASTPQSSAMRAEP